MKQPWFWVWIIIVIAAMFLFRQHVHYVVGDGWSGSLRTFVFVFIVVGGYAIAARYLRSRRGK